MIKLVPIDSIHASTYNPRKNDEKRLALTEMSLRKLGWLLPIFADENGEILSGHQRQYVARRMGYKFVPVQTVGAMSLEKRQATNVLFNRATNDIKKAITQDDLKQTLYQTNIIELCESVPDIEPDTEASYPCVHQIKRMDTMQLAKQNADKFIPHCFTNARMLEENLGGVSMPIIVDGNMNVLNGIGRLQVAAEKKRRFVQIVQVQEGREEIARLFLNMLSMDFDFKGRYADVLRYNAFMRERNTRETDEEGNVALGNGFYMGIFPKNNGRDFCKLEGKIRDAWIKKYGDKIVDFGAGKLNNTRILREAGIFVSAFEPYFVTVGDKVHKETSLKIANQFLDEVESGIEYTSVFISSVFNSVPFIEDREKIAVILAALCLPSAQVICWTQSEFCPQFYSLSGKGLKETKKSSFLLEYEPHTSMGDLNLHLKVQKGHSEEEMRRIFSPNFKNIKRLDLLHSFWYMEATQPVVDPKKLAEALDFEFELPYPDGSTLGLSARARQAFEKRLGIKLPPKEVSE
jgi:hypothetical protein